jgi:hypothetical protein
MHEMMNFQRVQQFRGEILREAETSRQATA